MPQTDGKYGAKSGVARIFKPQLGFEDFFQDERAVQRSDVDRSEKIPFFEWLGGEAPSPLAPQAGRPGFSPTLLNYASVSKGAILKFWFPLVLVQADPRFIGLPAAYRYFILFRDTNLAQYKDSVRRRSEPTQYHIPSENFGQPDTTAPVGEQDRFIIIAGPSTSVRQQPEPPQFLDDGFNPVSNPGGDSVRSVLRTEPVVPRPEAVSPLIINKVAGVATRGIHQQGLLDPANYDATAASGAGGMWFECQAQGDQMLICADREATGFEDATTEIWDFVNQDLLFSDFYGTRDGAHAPIPELGIYVYQIAGSL